ncbi:uncharacterized protein LOC122505284 [Leptopilina heterotoma]|uniref:uncharacterized protein LOC122505284 n=1 Tax=Leptopilina heterotoma TaxID=63436 RepID=UPI001CA94BE5|nr:uncharacterized protein LOC122505284 [Leptopilina heterotoma]
MGKKVHSTEKLLKKIKKLKKEAKKRKRRNKKRDYSSESSSSSTATSRSSRERTLQRSRSRSPIRDPRSRGRSRTIRGKRRSSSNERFRRNSPDNSNSSAKTLRGTSRRHDSSVEEHSHSGRRSPRDLTSREPSPRTDEEINDSERKKATSPPNSQVVKKKNMHQKDGEINPLENSEADPQSIKKNASTEASDLACLGGDPFAAVKTSAPINKTLAEVWQKIMQIGLMKEARKDLAEKHPPAENCSMMEAPILNPELKNIIGSTGVKKDQFQVASQNQLGAAISALGSAITELLSIQQQKNQSISNDQLTTTISLLSDSGKLLTDLHHEISLTRRNFITSGRDPKLKIVAENAPVDRFLFGINFAEQFKAAREVEKVSKELSQTTTKQIRKKPFHHQSRSRQSTSRPNDLNWKGPPKRSYTNPRRGGLQPYRTMRNQQQRN